MSSHPLLVLWLFGSFLVASGHAFADDVRVSLIWPSGDSATIQITDDPGPLNSWESTTQGVFDPASGVFVNQGQVGSAKGCGATDCWSLAAFDIDGVATGDTGNGVVNFAVDDLRIGDVTWSVLLVD